MPRSPGGSPSATALTLQVCTYNPLTDTATVLFDLNDQSTTFVHTKSFKLDQPKKVFSRSSNIRTPGEIVPRWQYQNRHITASIFVRGANAGAMLTTHRNLLAAIEQPPYVLCVALPGNSSFTYADVVAVTHNIPADPLDWLQNVNQRITLDFECRPGLRGDRLTLSNLVNNPGFEAPSGPSVLAFFDTFGNMNAYTVLAGIPTLASNVMTLPTNARVQFGSPAWGAVNLWQIRWQATSGSQPAFCLHFTNSSNQLYCQISGGGAGVHQLVQMVGGVVHVLATITVSLTASNFYWLQFTQFPAAPGNPPMVQVSVFNDTGPGSIGSNVFTLGPVATFDAVTALVGQPSIVAISNSLPIGGNFANVHLLRLFGPGGWQTASNGAITPTCAASLAWDGTRPEIGMSGTATAGTQTYPNGPVTSFGAARVDFGPAGTQDGVWFLFGAAAPAGSSAMPVATGNVVAASVWCKSSGLGANAHIQAILREYDVTGLSLLRQTTLQQLTGNQAAWTQISGTVTIGASTAFVDLLLEAYDNNAGASNNATTWFDNAQVYNQTTTGQTSMSYCELRFPQSPAQLLVSGLLGDMAAPAWLGLATYFTGSALLASFWLGRRAQASAGALLTAPTTYTPAPTLSHVLDATQYGGFYWAETGGIPEIVGNVVSVHYADQPGVYHLLTRAFTGQSAGNLPKVIGGLIVDEALVAWPTGASQVLYESPSLNNVAGFTNANGWNTVDCGQVAFPYTAAGGRVDPTKVFQTITTTLTDNNGGGVQPLRNGWAALIPADGSLLTGTINGSYNQATGYAWLYMDPTPASAYATDRPGATWTTSVETTAQPNPGSSGGGILANSTSGVNVTAGCDPYLTLDPTRAANSTGVNQFAAALVNTTDGTPYQCIAELVYSPLYLYPR